MDQSSILGIIGIALGVLGSIIGIINHTRIRSNCFGMKSEISLDIDKNNETPPKIQINQKLNSSFTNDELNKLPSLPESDDETNLRIKIPYRKECSL